MQDRKPICRERRRNPEVIHFRNPFTSKAPETLDYSCANGDRIKMVRTKNPNYVAGMILRGILRR